MQCKLPCQYRYSEAYPLCRKDQTKLYPLQKMHRPLIVVSVNYKDNLKDGLPFGYSFLAFIRSFNENSERGVLARDALLNDLIPVIS